VDGSRFISGWWQS